MQLNQSDERLLMLTFDTRSTYEKVCAIYPLQIVYLQEVHIIDKAAIVHIHMNTIRINQFYFAPSSNTSLCGGHKQCNCTRRETSGKQYSLCSIAFPDKSGVDKIRVAE